MAGSLAGDGRDSRSRRLQAATSAEVPSSRRAQLRYSLPWVAILFITAGFHFYRGVPVDGWIFLGVGMIVGADVIHQHRTVPGPIPKHGKRRLGGRWLQAVLLLMGLGTMAVVVLTPTGSVTIPVVVAIVGAAMLILAWPDPLPEAVAQAGRPGTSSGTSSGPVQARRPLRRAAWWWGSVLLFLALWELGSYFTDELDPAVAPAVPPLTDLLQPLFDNDASRWLMMLAWLAACAGLLKVARRP